MTAPRPPFHDVPTKFRTLQSIILSLWRKNTCSWGPGTRVLLVQEVLKPKSLIRLEGKQKYLSALLHWVLEVLGLHQVPTSPIWGVWVETEQWPQLFQSSSVVPGRVTAHCVQHTVDTGCPGGPQAPHHQAALRSRHTRRLHEAAEAGPSTWGRGRGGAWSG